MTSHAANARILMVLALIVASLALSAAAIPILLRWSITDFLETRLSLQEVEIGDLSLRTGSNSTLIATRVEANHAIGAIDVSKVTLSIETGSLFFSDRISIQQLIVSDWHVDLAVTESATDQETEPPVDLLTVVETVLVDFSHPIHVIDHLVLEQGTAEFVDADQDLRIEIAQARLSKETKSAFVIDLDGTLNSDALILDGRISRENLTTLFNGVGRWRSYALDLEGQLAHISPLSNLNARLTIKAPSSSPVLELLGAPEVRDGEFSVVAVVTGNNNQLDASGDVTLGAMAVSGDLEYITDQQDFVFDFELSGPSLREAGALFDYVEYGNKPFTISGLLEKQASRLALSGARIQLGDGYFFAEGELPEYPALENWKLQLEAKQFDLTLLQPVTSCPLPTLELDWQGTFFTDEDGFERANLEVSAGDQTVSMTGRFNNTFDGANSEVRMKLSDISSAHINPCINSILQRDLDVSGNIQISKPGDSWQIDSLALTSDALKLEGAMKDPRELEVAIEADDINSVTELFEPISFRFKSNPASLTANVNLEQNQINVNSGTIILGQSTGTFEGNVDFNGQGLLELALEGSDLADISDDMPNSPTLGVLPFRVTTTLSFEEDHSLSGDISLELAGNYLNGTGSTSLFDPVQALNLAVEGSGAQLETLLGAFVPYPLPTEPYDLSFNIESGEEVLILDNLNLVVGEQSLSGELMLDLWPNVERTRGQLEFQSASVDESLSLANVSYDGLDVPVDISLALSGSRDEITLDLQSAQFGDTDLTGTVTMHPGPKPELSADLRSNKVHLPTFIPALETSTDAVNQPINRNQPVIPDVELPWHFIEQYETDFRWQGESITLKQDHLAKATVAFSLSDGQLATQDVSWQSDLNQGELILKAMSEGEDNGSVQLELISQRIPALWLFAGTPQTESSEQHHFHTKLEGTGKTVRELTGNLNGAILFRDGGGRLSSARLDTLFGDFLHQLTTTVFRTGDQRTRVQCSAGALQVRNGRFKYEPGIAVRTNRFDVLTTGDVTFPEEKLNLIITSRSRKGIGVSAATTLVPRVGVSGTIVKPKLQLNARDTALTGGAAIASSGLSILATGLWDRLRSSVENPCDAVYNRAVNQGKEIYRELGKQTSSG
jgi:uncharacterized protein involved in outer membrane biogenesis